ncbi:hypothetical protein CDG81_20185 [Actinopolyspora erythraea]|uniref:Methyl-accepting transducer domain-containing protein n=1 Tax=Actinopolyspora erythraea TaxID=414996 RepID=A0A223RWF1_9ACTN|nr:ALF repeat-containing protein [Actinopolyspora erythraea]ASU80206.1 hypothetical protein CDG81_20185 [Actinopolyspora erythraea]
MDAAKQAQNVVQIARDAEAERIRADKQQAIAEAKEDADSHQEERSRAEWEEAEQNRVSEETRKLLNAAEAPDADPATVVSKGRQAAVNLLSTGGPWTKQAAQHALTGTDADVRQWVDQGRLIAAEQDDRARVAHIADTGEPKALREAAKTALDGSYADVKAFLRTKAYPGEEDDDRLRATQILASATGPAVKEAANAALDGTHADVKEFLETGQYEAREHDNRINVLRIMDSGGPRLEAAGQAALQGPPEYLRNFLDVGQHLAKERDARAAVHHAEMQRLVKRGMEAAAEAQGKAYEAAQSAAKARNAADEAAQYAQQAQDSASQAAQYADQAEQSAQQAKNSADRATQAAKTARDAAASARESAEQAAQSAEAATSSAVRAGAYADSAYASAAQARQSALEAGKDTIAAAEAALKALKSMIEKLPDDGAGEQPGDGGSDGGGGDSGDPGQEEYRDLEIENNLSKADAVVILLDIVGIFDPTPTSDTASGIISLIQGDWKDASLSAVSLLPYIGDLIAKPAKFKEAFKSLNNIAEFAENKAFRERIEHTLRSFKDRQQLEEAAERIDSFMGDAKKIYGKNKKYLEEAKKLGLPTEGPIPFVPNKKEGIKKVGSGRNKGYEDAYGNRWV